MPRDEALAEWGKSGHRQPTNIPTNTGYQRDYNPDKRETAAKKAKKTAPVPKKKSAEQKLAVLTTKAAVAQARVDAETAKASQPPSQKSIFQNRVRNANTDSKRTADSQPIDRDLTLIDSDSEDLDETERSSAIPDYSTLESTARSTKSWLTADLIKSYLRQYVENSESLFLNCANTQLLHSGQAKKLFDKLNSVSII